MSAMSDYLEQLVINLTLRAGTYTGGSVYLALHTADPTDDTTTAAGNEVTDSAYTRELATFDPPSTPGGSTTNAADIVFPAIADAQVTISHVSIWDSVTEGAGNLLYRGALTNPKTFEVSDVPSFPQGSLTITIA